MYIYSMNELVWAVTRDREEEIRQTRPHVEKKGATSGRSSPREAS